MQCLLFSRCVSTCLVINFSKCKHFQFYSLYSCACDIIVSGGLLLKHHTSSLSESIHSFGYGLVCSSTHFSLVLMKTCRKHWHSDCWGTLWIGHCVIFCNQDFLCFLFFCAPSIKLFLKAFHAIWKSMQFNLQWQCSSCDVQKSGSNLICSYVWPSWLGS